MNLRLQQYLNQILTWCDRLRIKFNPGKTNLLNFSQRKVISDTSIAMYGQPLKVIQPKFLGVIIDSHLNIKLHVKHTKRVCLVSRMRVSRLNSANATLLLPLYKIFIRPYMDSACTVVNALNKSKRQRLEVIQNLCLHYARRTVDSTCISNNELLSGCNAVSVEQRILALANS